MGAKNLVREMSKYLTSGGDPEIALRAPDTALC